MIWLQKFGGSVLAIVALASAPFQSVEEFQKIIAGKNYKRWSANSKNLSMGGCADGEIVYHFAAGGRVKKRSCRAGTWQDSIGSWKVAPDPVVKTDMKLSMFGDTWRLTHWQKTKTDPEHLILTKSDQDKSGATKSDYLYALK